MTRVLFIGLDAADRGLVAEAIAAGRMPTLGALAARGSAIDVEVPDAFFVGSVWPSFYTACATTRHGRYCFKQFEPGSYRARAIGPDIVPMDPFWCALDRAGRHVVVLDVPKSRLVPLKHGMQLCDWGTHDPERAGTCSIPPSLAEEIVRRHGEEPVGNCDRVGKNPAGFRAFKKNLLARIAAKEAMARDLMARAPWDFFAVCFGDSHCVGHQCWHLHDRGHERHPPAVAQAVGDPVLDIYAELDAAVGRLVEAAGEDCRGFVLCSHGMGRHYDGGHLMREALQRINGRLNFGRSREEQMAAYAGQVLPPAEAARLGIRYGESGLPLPARMRSFVVPNNDAFAGIRINVVGRELLGRIRPDEVDAYAAALMQSLSAVTIGKDGPKAFGRIFRTENSYPERSADDALPDIIAEWSRAAPYRQLYSPAIGLVEGEYRGVRTGDHRAGGRLFMAGPGIAHAERDAVTIESIGPTICAMLGVDLDGVDGRPIALSTGALAEPQRIPA